MTDIKGLECVLLVDDDQITNLIHKRVIESTGIEVEIRMCSNGKEALEYVLNEEDEEFIRPDLILLDINMPELNGWGFLEEYGKLPDSKKATAVIIMLTTSVQPEDKAKAAQNPNVEEFVSKTLTVEDFHHIVSHHFKA